MRALLSVSDKAGIVEFARGLEKLGWDIISTGGTYKALNTAGIKVIEIDEVTKFPECFEGRVKTLNPYVHGGILHKRGDAAHVAQAKELGVEGIDLVCVNLYPFKETIERTEDFAEIIENIDIGGPTMVRSAAKNFNDVLIVTDVNDYEDVLGALENSKVVLMTVLVNISLLQVKNHSRHVMERTHTKKVHSMNLTITSQTTSNK